MIKSYSKAKSGNVTIQKNFKVKEFACNDGSNTIYIDDKLGVILQKIRDWAKAAVKINSAYRTPAYNKKVGGASQSYHTKGQAADIVVTGKTPKQVAAYAQSIGVLGIGCYTGAGGNFVHVDTRTSRSFWVNTGKGDQTVTTHGGTVMATPKPAICPYAEPKVNLKRGSKGIGVKWVQYQLKRKGYSISIDGEFGLKTAAAVNAFQRANKLAVDGIVGAKTRTKLKG